MLLLYKNIRQRREELGMSQEELAHKLGYKSRSSINKIELGENDIPQSKIEAFAKALDVTPSYLMGWEEKAPVDASDEDLIDAKLRELIKDLTPEEMEKTMEHIDLLKRARNQ